MGEPDRTDDGHHILVGGRRWRATDPTIPEPFRKELVAELMDARRQVKAVKSDEAALERVRQRVQNAKVALGERGEPWWDPATAAGLEERARGATLALLTKRGPESSICPSDVARTIASPDWRQAMGAVRATAGAMADEGLVVITQKDRVVGDLGEVDGPIRLRLPSSDREASG